MTENFATLYVVPTPLGNLKDISERARETLTAVSWVAAEDTRHTAPLLRHLGSRAKLLSAHGHNENEAARQIVSRLAAGEAVALVSDAGTPAISDPGARIVAHARAAGASVMPLPGPCAATTALCAAGLEEAHWLFYGFLPARPGPRRKELEALRFLPYALAFYEAPHRILETVDDMAAILEPERTLVIARELTKLFESIHALPLGEAPDWMKADPNRQKGEFVLLLSGCRASGRDAESKREAERTLRLLLAENLPVKQAVRLAAAITGASRNTLYEQALELKGRTQNREA